MSKKWIGITLYFIFLVFLTYIFALYSEADKVTAFLNDNKEELLIDNEKLLSATVIANNRDNTQAYIKKEPLFAESFIAYTFDDKIKYSVDVYIYTLVEFKDGVGHNSLALIIKNLVISDEDAKITNKINDLHATITFSRNAQIGSATKKSSTESLTSLYDNDMRLLMFNYDKLLINSSASIDVESIALTYPTINDKDVTLLSLTNSTYTDVRYDDVFSETLNRDIVNVTYQNVDIYKQYQTTDYINQDQIYFNDQYLGQFNSHNSIVKYIGIEMLLVIPLTYFLFFHKHVKKIVKQKQLAKKKAKDDRYQQIKSEIYNNQNIEGKKD